MRYSRPRHQGEQGADQGEHRCSFNAPGEAVAGSAPGPIVLMSLQPVIPQWVALLHCPLPLHRLDSMYHSPAETVNHHLARAGEFSTGTMRNFQPVLTQICIKPLQFPAGAQSARETRGLRVKSGGRVRPARLVLASGMVSYPDDSALAQSHGLL